MPEESEPQKKPKAFLDWIFDGDEENPDPEQNRKPIINQWKPKKKKKGFLG